MQDREKSLFLFKTFIMKKIFILVFAIISLTVYSQINIPANSPKGTITTQTNQKIEYRNLRYEKGKVFYINILSNQEEFLYENSVKNIKEDDGTAEPEKASNNTVAVPEPPKDLKLTSKKDIKNFLMKENNVQYKNGKTINNIGTGLIAGGGALFLIGGISNVSKANKAALGEDSKGSSVPLIIGLAGAGIGVIMKLSGHSQMKKAINNYKNTDIRKFTPSYYVLNDGNGVGFMMKF